MQIKTYLSGPMTGLPNFNYPEFNRVAALLRAKGEFVFNPTEHNWDVNNFPIREAFATYCNFICLEADKIVLLKGWQNSLGVSAELALAKNCGLIVEEWADDAN